MKIINSKWVTKFQLQRVNHFQKIKNFKLWRIVNNDTSSNRISKRISSDKFEIQGKDFRSKIDNAYNKIFKNNNDVVEIVTDGEKNIAQNKIRDCIDKIINAAGK